MNPRSLTFHWLIVLFFIHFYCLFSGIYDDDQEIITLSRADFGKILFIYLAQGAVMDIVNVEKTASK